MDKIENFKVNSPRWLSLEDFEGEIWKDIPEFKGWYQISTCGRVRALKRSILIPNRYGGKTLITYKQHIMFEHDNGHGYLFVALGGKKVKQYYVHRLVALAFLPNLSNKQEIDHINTRRGDNRLCNLRWVNKSENSKNPITVVKRSISQSEAVVVLDCWGNYVCEYYGAQAAADAMGIERSVIVDAIHRKRNTKTANGYQFVKKSDYDTNKKYKIIFKKGTSPYVTIPSDRMVLVFRENSLYTVFPNTVKASQFYEICVSWISSQCRRNAKGLNTGRKNVFGRDKLYYLKDVSKDIQKQALSMFKEKYSNNNNE